MADPASAFWRVKEPIRYRLSRTLIGEIIPGIWEEELLEAKLGEERLRRLIASGVVMEKVI